MIIKKLNKVGHGSKAILIDKSIIKLLGIKDKVKLTIEDDKIVLTPYEEVQHEVL